jgi:hypothetical protein
MSIEKLDFETIEKEQVPFVMVSTNVIQNIKNPTAGFMWVYFSSLPHNWKINKSHIMSHFDISERTYQRHMSYLKSHNLIEYRRNRLPNGTLGSVTLVCLNGLKFNASKGSDHNAKFDIVVTNHTAKKPHSGETTAVVSGTLINTITSFGSKKRKDILNIVDSSNTTTESNSISTKPEKKKAPKDYKSSQMFMRLYEAYPKKQKPHDAYKAFLKLNADEIMVDMIIDDIKKRLAKDDHWQEMQFIPFPATYLNAKYWEGDICNSEEQKAENKAKAKQIADEKVKKLEELSRRETEKKFQYIGDAHQAQKITTAIMSNNAKNMSELLRSLRK